MTDRMEIVDNVEEKQAELKPETPTADATPASKSDAAPDSKSDAAPDSKSDGEPDAKKKHEEASGPKLLDLAFAMDCTGSMGSYIHSAQQNIRKIVEEIWSQEKADTRLALVEYRDHPPQDSSFVTNVHDFTTSVREMKKWLDGCQASGGGDQPEAVADALFQVFKLNWRPDATKVCVFIADAPPHGLGCGGDGFPNGCPNDIDCMDVTNNLTQKGVSLYMVGCEPSITPYKDFFMGLAHLTGGQYVPLASAHLLSKVIVGGVQEEMSLQQLMEEVNQEVQNEFAADADEIEEEVLTRKVHMKMKSKGYKAKKLQRNAADLEEASDIAQKMSSCPNMVSARSLQVASRPDVRSAERERSMHVEESGGFLSRMFGGLTRRSKGGAGAPPPPPPSGAYGAPPPPPPPGAMPMASAPPMATASMSDSYDCVEDEISEQQVQRMVQKSVWSNELKTRYKKKH